MLRPALTATCLALVVGLSACGGEDGADGSPTGGGSLQVATSFYPLEFIAGRLGGDLVEVENLTAPGAEPHDLELTPQQVAGLTEDDLVVYLQGFQPAVDEAVDQQASDAAFDVSGVTDLQPGYIPIEEGVEEPDEEGDDPHVWLEPLRYADIADAVAERMGELSPDDAGTFIANAATLRAELEALDEDFSAGLADCERREVVTSHNAYGYLAGAYDLEQVSLTGLTPEDEASPARLAEVADFARERGVTTIFFEELVSPAVAESLAAEVGAEAVALSPLEGSPGTGDYFTEMRGNLQTLQAALGCPAA